MYRIRVARKLSWTVCRASERRPPVGGRREGRRPSEGRDQGRQVFQGKQDIRRQPKGQSKEFKKKEKAPDVMSIEQIMSALKLDMDTPITQDRKTPEIKQKEKSSRTLAPVRADLQKRMQAAQEHLKAVEEGTEDKSEQCEFSDFDWFVEGDFFSEFV